MLHNLVMKDSYGGWVVAILNSISTVLTYGDIISTNGLLALRDFLNKLDHVAKPRPGKRKKRDSVKKSPIEKKRDKTDMDMHKDNDEEKQNIKDEEKDKDD